MKLSPFLQEEVEIPEVNHGCDPATETWDPTANNGEGECVPIENITDQFKKQSVIDKKNIEGDDLNLEEGLSEKTINIVTDEQLIDPDDEDLDDEDLDSKTNNLTTVQEAMKSIEQRIGYYDKDRYNNNDVQAIIDGFTYDPTPNEDGTPNWSGDEVSMKDGHAQYTFNVLADHEYLTDGNSDGGMNIEKYHDKVSYKMLKSFLPVDKNDWYENPSIDLENFKEYMDNILIELSDVGGGFNVDKYYDYIKKKFIKENISVQIYANANPKVRDFKYMDLHELHLLRCQLRMQARYTSKKVTTGWANKGVSHSEHSQPLTEEMRMAGGDNTVTDMCNQYATLKTHDDEVIANMLIHYSKDGNLRNYNPTSKKELMLTHYPGAPNSSATYEYGKKILDFKNKKKVVTMEGGIIRKTEEVPIMEYEWVPEVYRTLYTNDLKNLRAKLLLGPDGKKLYKTREEQLWLDDFISTLSEGRFNVIATNPNEEMFSAHNVTPEINISEGRGFLGTGEEWNNASLEEKLSHLHQYKKDLITEMNIHLVSDVEVLLDYLGISYDDATVEKFLELREQKLVLINDVIDFENSHLPSENEEGELVYPQDIQDFDINIKKSIGKEFFRVGGFEAYFEGVKMDECPLIREVDERAFQDDKVTHKKDEACLKRMDQDLKNHPTKYWKVYISEQAGDDEDDRQEYWDAYLRWRDEDYIAEVISEHYKFVDILQGAIATISKNKFDEYGMEEKMQNKLGFMSIVGLPEIISKEIREGSADVRWWCANSEWGKKHLGTRYAKGLDGQIRMVANDPVHTMMVDRGLDKNPLTGIDGRPQQIPPNTEHGRWCLSPMHRLEGYYVDENNKLKKMNLEEDMDEKVGVIVKKAEHSLRPGQELDQSEIKAFVEKKIEVFVQAKVFTIQQKGYELFGEYSDDAEFDNNGVLINGIQVQEGAIQKWEKKWGEDFERYKALQEQMSYIKVIDGEVVFVMNGEFMKLNSSQIEYFTGIEQQYHDLTKTLITGKVEGKGAQGVITASAFEDLRLILAAMDELQRSKDDFEDLSARHEKTNYTMGKFNLNFDSWDKAMSNIAMTWLNVLTVVGLGEAAREYQEWYSKVYPQAYKSEWGDNARWIESMLVESSGTVSLYVVAAGLMMTPGGQFTAPALFHAAGTGGMYNTLTTAKIDAQTKIKECQKMLDDPDRVWKTGEKMSLYLDIEAAEQAANQDETSIIFSSLCAGTIEMLLERYITLPMLKGPWKRGGGLDKAKWRTLTLPKKITSGTGYVLKVEAAEILSEDLTTLAHNFIEIVNTGDGEMFKGILTETGEIDFDAQMQLLATTLLLTGPGHVKMLTNVISTELSTIKDRKERARIRDRVTEVEKEISILQENKTLDPKLHKKKRDALYEEKEKLREEMVVFTEQSFNRLKYLSKKELTEIDKYCATRRDYNLQLFELGRTKDPKNKATIAKRKKLLKDIANIQLKIDGVIETSMANSLPNIKGSDNSYGKTKKKIVVDGVETEIDVINWAKVRPEAQYLEGLYLSSNIRTRNIVEKNGGSYFEISDKNYNYDEKGNVIGFNEKTQKILLKHFVDVYKDTADPIAQATQALLKILEGSLNSGNNAMNMGKDVVMFTTNARRAIYNTPAVDGKTEFTLQEAQDAAVSGLHEVFHINHMQQEITIKVDVKDGKNVYKTMTVSDVVNTEKGKKHANLVVSEMDKLMEEEFGSKKENKEAQEIWEHYKTRKDVYTSKDGVLDVEEVLNIIGDLIAVGNFTDINSKYKTSGVLNFRFFDLNSGLGQTLKMLINGINRRITGNDMVNLGQFNNAEQIFNYINKFYENTQGKNNFNIVQKIVGESFEKTEFKLSKSEYEKNLDDLKDELSRAPKKYEELIKGLEGQEKQDVLDEHDKKVEQLKKDIAKIEKNIATANSNDVTIEILQREQLDYDLRKKELIELKEILENHGEGGAEDPLTGEKLTLEGVIEKINNLAKNGNHQMAESKLLEDNKGIIQDYIRDTYKNVPGSAITKDDFVDAMNEELTLIINSFKPESLVTDVNGVEPGGQGYITTNPNFGFYLRNSLRYREGNIFRKAEANIEMDISTISYDDDNTFIDDIEDAGGFNPDNINVGNGVNSQVQFSEFRQTLPNITEKVRNKIIKDASKLIEKVGTFQGLLNKKKDKTRRKLEKQFADSFKDLIIEGIGEPTIKIRNATTGKLEIVPNPKLVKYLKKNKELIVSLTAVKYRGRFPGLAIKGKRLSTDESARLSMNPDYKGYIRNEKAGNYLWHVVQFDDPDATIMGPDGVEISTYMSVQDFVNYFTMGDGTKKGIRNARETRYDALTTSLASEMGLDATFDAINEMDPTDIDNYTSHYIDILKRDPKTKFSSNGKTFVFDSNTNWEKFRIKTKEIFEILKSGDHADLIDLDPESDTFMTIRGYTDATKPPYRYYTQEEVAFCYRIIKDLNPENIDQSSVQFRTTLLNDKNVPQHFKDLIQAVSWSSGEKMLDRKSEQASDFAIENMSFAVYKILGLDLLGFHHQSMDSAATKYLKNKDEKGLVVTKALYNKQQLQIILDGKEVKNQSFYGALPTKKELLKMTDEEIAALEFGVYDVVGWEYIAEKDAFGMTGFRTKNPKYNPLDQLTDENSPYIYSSDPVTEHGAKIRTGKYFDISELTKAGVKNNVYNGTVDLSKVRPMNKSLPLFKKITKILEQDIPKESYFDSDKGFYVKGKLELLEALASEIEDASVANRALAVEIVGDLLTSVANGKMDPDVFASILQSQTSLAKGLRALCGLDFIYVEDGSQWERTYGEHMKPNVRLMLRIQMSMFNLIDFVEEGIDKGKAIGFKEGVDMQAVLEGIFADHTQFFANENIARLLDKPVIDGVEMKLSTTDLEIHDRLKLLPPEYLENTHSPDGKLYQDRVIDIETTKLINSETKEIKIRLSKNKIQEQNNFIKRETRKNSLLSGESQGASVFDFDETLIIGGKNIIYAIHPVTKETFPIKAEDFHSLAAEYTSKGFEFNFDDFINVKGGKQGPLFQKFLNQIEKYGVEDIYILTARQPGAALAIQIWLKQNGVDLPLENITGLGVMGPDGKPIFVDGKDKAKWIEQNLIKNGFNDIYFVDDSQAIVNDVKEMMLKYPKEILLEGGKSIVVDPDFKEINARYSKSTNSEVFNDFLEITHGIDLKTGEAKFASEKRYSAATARLAGSKIGTYNNVIPYSAEDFNGLLYQFLAKGDEGEYQYRWFQENLVKPYSRGEVAISQDKVRVTSEYKNLTRSIPGIKKKLRTTINRPDGTTTNFTLDHAVRVYLWSEVMGIDMVKDHGISERDLKLLVNTVASNPTMVAFAKQLSAISNQDAGYIKPSEYWTIENISSDINNIINVVGREKHLAEFLENKKEVFSKENMNKIEAIYGPKFRESLELMLDRMETGNSNGKQSVKGDRVTDMYNTWVNNSVGAIMFLNGRSAVLQTLSTANYIKMSGPNNMFNAAQAFANQPQFWADFVTLWNSDYLVSRRSGQARGINEAELAAAVKNADNKPKAAVAWLLQQGFLPTQIADSFAICAGGASYVRNYTNTISDMLLDFKASGADVTTLFEAQDIFTKGDLETHLKGRDIKSLTDQELQDLAYGIANDAFVLETESGQQSSRQDMLSQQQTGGLGRLILAFKNTPMQYTRKILRASQDLKNGRGSTSQHLADIAYYGVVQNLMFVGLQQALFASLGEEDEEWDEKTDDVIQGMVDSILNGMGLGGVVTATVKNGVLEFLEQEQKGWNADHTYTILEFANFSPTIGSKLRKIYSAIQTAKFNEEAIDVMSLWDPQNPAWSAIANLISAFTNIPADRMVNKINNLITASSSETEFYKKLTLLLGWNTWDLDVETKADRIQEEEERKKTGEKKITKKEEQQIEINIDVKKEIEEQKEQKKEGDKVEAVTCASVSSSGDRCKMKVNKAGDKCQYHADDKGDVKQCSAIKKDKTRCKEKTTNKSGRCQYHPKESK